MLLSPFSSLFFFFFSFFTLSLFSSSSVSAVDDTAFCQYTFDTGDTYNISGGYNPVSDYCFKIDALGTFCVNPCHNSLTCAQQNIFSPLCIQDRQGTYSGCGDLSQVNVTVLDSDSYFQIFESICTAEIEYRCSNLDIDPIITTVTYTKLNDKVSYRVTVDSRYGCPLSATSFSSTQGAYGLIHVNNFESLDTSLNTWSLDLTDTMDIPSTLFVVYGREEDEDDPTMSSFSSFFFDSSQQSGLDFWQQLSDLITTQDPAITSLGIVSVTFDNSTSTTTTTGESSGSSDDEDDKTVTIVLAVVLPFIVVSLAVTFYIVYKRRQKPRPSRDYALYQGL